MFRKVFQLCGVLLIGWYVALTIGLTEMLVAGQITLGSYLVWAFIQVGFGCGLGVMMIVFNPHSLIQNYYMKFHRMVDHRRDRRSFAEKIGVDEEE